MSHWVYTLPLHTKLEHVCGQFLWMDECLDLTTSGCCRLSRKQTRLVTVSMTLLCTRQRARCGGAEFAWQLASMSAAFLLAACVGQSQTRRPMLRSLLHTHTLTLCHDLILSLLAMFLPFSFFFYFAFNFAHLYTLTFSSSLPFMHFIAAPLLYRQIIHILDHTGNCIGSVSCRNGSHVWKSACGHSIP